MHKSSVDEENLDHKASFKDFILTVQWITFQESPFSQMLLQEAD